MCVEVYSILYNFCNIQFHKFPDVKSVQLDNIDRGFYYNQNTVLPLIVSSLSIYQSLAVQTVMNQPGDSHLLCSVVGSSANGILLIRDAYASVAVSANR